MSFRNTKIISITSPQKGVHIYYTSDGTEPGIKSTRYTGAFRVNHSVVVKAIAIGQNESKSFVSTATYKKVPHNWSVKLNTVYEQQYDGGGSEGLIDGIKGSTNWRMGNWQGYQKTNIDAVIDLKTIRPLSSVSAGFLQDTRSWIIMPKEVRIEVSADGKSYTEVYKGNLFLPIEDLKTQLRSVDAEFPQIPARYVRIIAVQYGKMPAWHEGAGGDSHIFIDEISIR